MVVRRGCPKTSLDKAGSSLSKDASSFAGQVEARTRRITRRVVFSKSFLPTYGQPVLGNGDNKSD